MIFSKKMVCKEELIPTTASHEMVCSVLEVREIREDDDGKRRARKRKADGKTASPFTYKDLLKRSEEVRKATELEMGKNKKDDCRK